MSKENVKRFVNRMGEVDEMSKPLTQKDIEHIEMNATNKLHVARHFSVLPQEVIDDLLGQECEFYDYNLGKYVPGVITEDVLTETVKTPGSKFNSADSRLKTPAAVIKTCRNILSEQITKEQIVWEEKDAYWQIELVKQFEEPIGTAGVIEVSELLEEERYLIERKVREDGGPFVSVLKGTGPRYTKNLALGIYKRKDTGNVYITAYPGTVGGPQLPSAEQSEVDRKVSEEYWSKQVFLE